MTNTKTESSTKQPKLVECPRDAMQGLTDFVPTALKIQYLNLLLQVGFDTLDFGSFVSPRAIPQMCDTSKVLASLDLSLTQTKLLAIVANLRGVKEALEYPLIDYLGFPFSISETFQQRNTNSSISQSLSVVEEMISLCSTKNKQVVVYLSMGFGNPYGDGWNEDMVLKWSGELANRGVTTISIADTIGSSTPLQIKTILPQLAKAFPEVEFGLHLHAAPHQHHEKIQAAFEAGCTRFDSALRGFGGCPMAKNDLTGNIATENVIDYLNKQGVTLPLDMQKWQEALAFSQQIFG